MMFGFNWDEARRGAQESVVRASERFSGARGTQMSVQAPTRYGKTAMGVLIAGTSTRGWVTQSGMVISPFAATNVWVTINVMLRKQAVNKKKAATLVEILGINQPLLFSEVKNMSNHRQIAPNGENFVSVNIHKMDNNSDLLIWEHWVKSVIDSSGLPPIFHFDEIHFHGEGKPWGDIVETITGYGANVVTYTATPQRADNLPIPGFEKKLMGKSKFKRTVVKDEFEDDEGNEFLLVDDYHGEKTDYSHEAHVRIPFSEAWQEGYLCKVSRRKIRVDYVGSVDPSSSGEASGTMLRDLTANQCKKMGAISKSVQDLKVIREGVRMAYESLLEHRRVTPDAAIVVFTVSDRDSIKNQHAKAIKKEFLSIDKDLKIDIATQNVDDAHKIIDSFEDSGNDIIMFKGMGGVGWDCARVCVVLDLGNDRQEASKVQAWMRGGTPTPDKRTFRIIVPEDALADSIWKKCIDDEGGVATEEEIISEQERMTEKKKKRDGPDFFVTGAGRGEFDTHEGDSASGEDDAYARALYELIPGAIGHAPDAEMVNKAKSLGFTRNVSEVEKSIDEMLDGHLGNAKNNIHDATKLAYWKTYDSYDGRQWGKLSTNIYRIAYERAGIPWGKNYVKVDEIRDLGMAERLDVVAQAMKDEFRR